MVDRGEHPYVGAMLADRYAPNVSCSGTMISSRVFLTAAHCTNAVFEMGRTKAYVTLDETYRPGGSKVYPGTMYQMAQYDPDYQGGEGDPYDLAVIVLDRPHKLRKYGRLPYEDQLEAMDQEGLLADQRLEPVGYGTYEGPDFGGLGSRRKTNSWAFSMGDSLLVLLQRPELGESGTCGGDSGGPIFLGDSRVIAATVTSGDPECLLYSKNYRLDRPVAREFLANFVALP